MSLSAEKNEVKHVLLKHQAKVMKSSKKNIFMGGGVGSGKTDIGSLWALRQADKTPDGVLGLITANTYTQLIDSTCRNIFKNWQTFGVQFEPKTLPQTSRPFNFRVLNEQGIWIEILCRSLDNYETLSGTEVGWGWSDELWQTKQDAMDLFTARVRDSRMHNQKLFTTTLDDPTSWMYSRFVENYKEDIDEVLYATSYDNPFLPDGYIDELKATYSKQMFQRMCMAEWVYLEGLNVYYAFGNHNVSERAEFDPALPILWTWDFNIGQGKPMSSCLCQIKKSTFYFISKLGSKPIEIVRPELHVFDEIVLDTADTHEAILEFKERAWAKKQRQVYIYGDASGKARDTRSKKNDYEIIYDAGFEQQRVPSSNPPIRERHNMLNGLCQNAQGDIRLYVHPRCKTVIAGLRKVKVKKGSSYLEEEIREQHVTTALGYLVHYEFKENKSKAQQVVSF